MTDYLALPHYLWDREGDSVAELVRTDPREGYVKGNVVVVSRRAAQFIEFFRAMQTDPAELRLLAAQIEDGEILL